MELKPGIKDIQVYLPEKMVSNQELVEEFGFDADFLEKKVGIVKRHIASENETVSDMAVKVGRILFHENRDLSPETVNLLVVCTQNSDFKIPHTAAIVQNQLGIPSIATFDINLACSGFVYSLAVVLSFMESQGMQNAILITSEAYSKVINKKDRDTMAIFGDAACAVWIGLNCECRPMQYSFGTNGKDYDKLILKDGGSHIPLHTYIHKKNHSSENSEWLHMDGREIFNFMLKQIPGDTLGCLAKNGMAMSDIDYFIFHQANKFMLDCLCQRLNIPKEKMVYSLRETGNTVSSSIPIALKHLMETNKLSGKKVFISGFGAGLSWASTVLKFK